METRTLYLPLTLLGIMAFLAGCSAQVQIDSECPRYVSEGGTLVCSCVYAAPNAPPGINFSWPGHSNSDQIKIENVGRALNGTDFTCEVTANGKITRVVYTLQVAYGPADVSITGPRPIITNGIDPVTLTCIATEVNPTPKFTWTGVNCSNGNQGNDKDTCTFTPTPADEGKVVTCTALNSLVGASGKTASGNFTLSVNYTTTTTTPAPVTTTTTTTTKTTPAPTTTTASNPNLASTSAKPPTANPNPVSTSAKSPTANPNPGSTSAKSPTANPNPGSTSAKQPTATPTQSTSAIITRPSSQQTASLDTSATTKKQTVPDGPTSGGATTQPGTPSTAAGGITPGGGTGDSTTPMAQPQKGGDTFPMAILGGCLGALFLLILIIIIIVYCRKRQERDVRLVNRAESNDGSYKHASDNEFYFFENNGYDRGGMQEIEPAKPVNSMPPASQSRPNSQALERTLDPYSTVPTETQEVSVRVDADDPMEENPEGSPNDAATVEEINEDPVKRTSVGMGAFSSLEKQEVSLSFPDEPIPEGSFGEADTLPPPPSPPSFPPDNQDLDSGEGRGHSTGPLGDVYAEVSRRRDPEDHRTETVARSVNFADDTDDLPDDYPSQLSTSDETLTYFP